MVIDSFTGNYRFLSNFYLTPDGLSVEHHYQAAKAIYASDYRKILNCETAAKAKRMGATIPMRPDWHQIKLVIMEQLLRQKFSNHMMATLLLQTAGSTLIEGNTWGDTFWGVSGGSGSNHLGKLLMKIRDEFLETDPIKEY